MKLDILIRQLLAALGGYFALDTTSTPVFIASLLTIGFTVLWSWIQKANFFNDHITLDESVSVLLQKLLGAVVSQLIAALSGVLMTHGFTGDVNDLGGVVIFGANVAASHFKLHQRAVGAPLNMLALCSLPFALCSCSGPSQEALKSRLEAAFVSAGREVSAVALQSTITTLKGELALLEAKPVDADPMQQLLDQSRMQAIRAAIRLGEERLAKLRGGKDVIEVNAVGVRSRFQVSSFTSYPRGSDAGDRPARLEGHRPTPEVSIPLYAPQVVASLQRSTAEMGTPQSF